MAGCCTWSIASTKSHLAQIGHGLWCQFESVSVHARLGSLIMMLDSILIEQNRSLYPSVVCILAGSILPCIATKSFKLLENTTIVHAQM